jgi:hypothetical protein
VICQILKCILMLFSVVTSYILKSPITFMERSEYHTSNAH